MNKYINKIKNSNYLKDTTKLLYLKHFDIIEKEISKKKLINVIKEPEKFKKDLLIYCSKHEGRIGKKLGDHFKESYLTSIMSLFIHNEELREKNKKLFEKWKEIQKQIKKPIEKKYNSNKPTERQKEALIDFDKLIEIKNSLPIGSLERLLFCMYIIIPPVRADYYKTILYDNDEIPDNTNNYIQNGVLYLHNFKTSEIYKEIKTILPKELKQEIEFSLKKFPRNYLFINKQKKPFKRNSFTKWSNSILKKYVNKNFSLTMFRHIYISKKIDLNNMNGSERKKISSKMAHSNNMQLNYLWK